MNLQSSPGRRAILRALFCLIVMTKSYGEEISSNRTFTPHPAAESLQQIFSTPPPNDFTTSNITRRDYLSLIAADIDFFKRFQNSEGAVIDPYVHQEIQYSTPAFALATAILVKEDARPDLKEAAVRALSRSITDLVQHHAANGHSDFYIPLIIHAFGVLKDEVPASLRSKWEEQLEQIDIAHTYNGALRGMNWNIVSSCGELLRRQTGLVPSDQRASQMDYLETSLAGHISALTRFGMYRDPGAPLAYDEFARLWLEDMMSHGAYGGKFADRIRQFLRVGGLSTLLLLSPSGEWASGGRSAFHNWNEAETAVICEINASKWNRAGRSDVAGAFKRAAHLALISMRRWQRPTGDLWIVKNRAEPESRLGFEVYSYHTQYNLLPMAMLALAYEHADDSIPEHPTPAETGGYVFDLRDVFHKIVAAAGGYYVLIDTAADPHYNATGLQRVHKSGVAFSSLSDSTAAQRAYGPKQDPALAMTPGLQWNTTSDAAGPWLALADFSDESTGHHVGSIDVKVADHSPRHVAFELDYSLITPGEPKRRLIDQYSISPDGVRCQEQITGGLPVSGVRFCFPALVNDGAADTRISMQPDGATIDDFGSVLQWRILSPQIKAADTKLDEPRIPCHNGYMQPLIAALPAGAETPSVTWQVDLAARRDVGH
jgi:hypothetical protein